jgi:serine/threonine-protein kinase
MRARFTIVPPGGMVLPYPPGRLAISPDGRQIVFAVKAGTTVRLVARDVTSGALTPVPESDGVTSIPFWSPDSQWIAFAAGTKLRRVSIATGAAQTICDLPAIVSSNPLLPTVASAASGTWNASGTILFSVGSALYGSKYPLFRVPATGGQAVALTTLDAAKQETEHAFPEFLPDGTLFLFLVRRGGAAATVVAGSLNDPAMRKPILDNDMRVSVAGNSIVYPRGGGSSGGDVLYAQSFDHRTLAVTGQPLAIATDIAGTTVIRSVSAAGDRALVFENRKAAEVTQFTWYDRRGKKLGTAGEPASYDPSFSMTRDGRRFAFIRDGDVWAFDVTHRTQVRLTTDPALDNDPVWSPDGSKVMFDSPRRGTFDVFVKTVGSAGPETVVLATDHPEFVEEWSPDGRYVVLVQHPENDLIALSLADRQTIRITQDTFRQDEPRFSPNGKWLAYSSDESGSPEIYVTAFPPMGTRHLVSAGTGVQPRWAADGRELYYLVPDGTIMSAHIDPSTAMPTSSAKPLFKTKLSFVTDIWDQYDVTNDGRFIVLEPIGPPEPGGITVITNWTAGRK